MYRSHEEIRFRRSVSRRQASLHDERFNNAYHTESSRQRNKPRPPRAPPPPSRHFSVAVDRWKVTNSSFPAICPVRLFIIPIILLWQTDGDTFGLCTTG